MATVIITGGTGMIGSALAKLLFDRGHHVIILSRHRGPGLDRSLFENAVWNIPSQTIDQDAIRRADHIIHLAGANVGEKRWTKKRKQEILESRTQSSALLVKALKEIRNKVQSVISASGMGWYGPDDATVIKRGGFTESDPASD